MTKRLISWVMIFCMAMMLLPVPVAAASASRVEVNGKELKSGSSMKVGGGTAAYKNGVLTLTNAKITRPTKTSTGNEYGIYAFGGISIKLVGKNSIILPKMSNKTAGSAKSAGVCIMGNLKIYGTGSLTVTAGTSNLPYRSSEGIYVFGDLTLSGATVRSTGAKAYYSCGVNVLTKLKVSSGTLSGKTSSGSVGVTADAMTLSGGTVEGFGRTGVRSYGKLNISGGRLVATGSNLGIYSLPDITITGGSLEMKGLRAVNRAVSVSPGAWYEWKASTSQAVTGPYVRSAVKAYTHSDAYQYLAIRKIPAPTYAIGVTSDGYGSAKASRTTAAAGTKITLLDSPKRGYRLKGWQVLEGDIAIKSNSFTMPKKAVKVNAIHQVIGYSVTYRTKGGKTISKKKYTVNSASFRLPTPKRSGYRFAGWYKNSTCTKGKTVIIKKGTTGNKVFYAKWVRNK